MSLLILLMVPAFLALVVFALNTNTAKENKIRSRYDYWRIIPKQITLKEFALQLLIQSVLICAAYSLALYNDLGDNEIWNGIVNRKAKEQVSCEHSYPCNPHDCMCSTDENGNTSCSTCYDTCYDHSYDIDWNVFNNIGETFTIDRIDRQGLQEPARWTEVKVGDATASRHSYTNYIKYSANSLFKQGNYGTQYSFAEYPLAIRDYYKLDRLIDQQGIVKDREAWNLDISSVASALGSKHQVNLVVYLTKNKESDFFNGLEYSWAGGKKNDVVLVIDVDDKNNIVWADVMALVKDEYFKVKLRDDIQELKTLDRAKILSVVREDITKYYKRRPMADFKYLLHATKISTTGFIITLIFSVILSLGLSFWMKEEDVA